MRTPDSEHRRSSSQETSRRCSVLCDQFTRTNMACVILLRFCVASALVQLDIQKPRRKPLANEAYDGNTGGYLQHVIVSGDLRLIKIEAQATVNNILSIIPQLYTQTRTKADLEGFWFLCCFSAAHAALLFLLC